MKKNIKKIVVLFLMVFAFAGAICADRYDLNKTPLELNDFFWPMSDQEVGGILNNVDGLFQGCTFYGYGNRVSFWVVGGTAQIFGNWQVNAPTQTISSTSGFPQGWEDTFSVERGSPTIAYVTLTAGASVHWQIGGKKE